MSKMYIKCDVCGKYVDEWFEPNGLCDYGRHVWETWEVKEIQHICLKCKDEINKVISDHLKRKR